MIAGIELPPPPILAACGVGLALLVPLVARARRGAAFPERHPAPFLPASPAPLLLAGFGLLLLSHPLLLPAHKGWGAFLALGGGALLVAASTAVWFFLLRRVFRPRGSEARRAGEGLVICAAALPLVYGAGVLMQAFGLDEVQSSVEEIAQRRPGWIVKAVLAVIVAPVVEEVLFRGCVYPALRAIHGWRPALLVSAVLFGLVHAVPAVILPMVLFGLALGWLAERTGSLLAPIVAHAAFNGLTVATLLAFGR